MPDLRTRASFVRLDGRRLRHGLAVRGVAARDLALEARIHPQTVYAALAGKHVSLVSARRIVLALARLPVVEGLAELVSE